LYGGQVSSSKTTIQKIKVEKETKVNKVVFHSMKIKEDIANLKLDPTSNKAIYIFIYK
jgi:hypothetical protein